MEVVKATGILLLSACGCRAADHLIPPRERSRREPASADALSRYNPSREKGFQKNPQIFLEPKYKNIFPLKCQSEAETILNRLFYINGLSRRSTLSSTVPGRLVRQSVTCTSRHRGSVACTSSRKAATALHFCSSTPHSKCRNRLR